MRPMFSIIIFFFLQLLPRGSGAPPGVAYGDTPTWVSLWSVFEGVLSPEGELLLPRTGISSRGMLGKSVWIGPSWGVPFSTLFLLFWIREWSSLIIISMFGPCFRPEGVTPSPAAPDCTTVCIEGRNLEPSLTELSPELQFRVEFRPLATIRVKGVRERGLKFDWNCWYFEVIMGEKVQEGKVIILVLFGVKRSINSQQKNYERG